MKRIITVILLAAVLLGGCGLKSQAPPASPPPGPQPSVEQPQPNEPGEPEPQAEPQGEEEPPPPPPEPEQREHVDIHGLYMTGWSTGSDEKFYEIVEFMKATGLNAMVIDAKDDDGRLSWAMDVPLAIELGANANKVADIEGRLKVLKENGIYAIARVVVYADPLLGSKKPEYSIHLPDGTLFRDSRGIAWPNPYEETVWKYNVDIAIEAAKVGFDEIQFDYIRFPERWIDGINDNVPVKQRTDAIEGFLRYAKQQLEPYGVFVSADVFGLTTSVAEGDDMKIGQDYRNISEIVDYIKPMVYPSHYANWSFGIEDPNQAPDVIVRESMIRAQKRTLDLDVRKHRPWIQDFDMGKDYTAADVEAQILGLAEAGIYQWILWDPANNYTRGVNYKIAGEPPAEEPAWKVEYRQQLEAEAAAKAAEEQAAKEAEAQQGAEQNDGE